MAAAQLTTSTGQGCPALVLAPEEIVVTFEHLGYVEGIILLHLLLHKVLHDAGIEVVAGLLTRLMSILRVVQQCLARLWRVLVELTSARIPAALVFALVRCIFRGLAVCACLRLLRLVADLRNLVHQDHLRQFRSDLETLKLGVEELRTRFNDLIEQHRLLRNVVTGGGSARP